MNNAWIRAGWAAPDCIIAGTTLRSTSFDSCDIPGDACWLTQVHGADVISAGHYETPPEADASVGDVPGRICVVRTADCLPVLICSADGKEVAAAHAGWRGLAAGVLEATVGKMSHAAGDLLVWLGPAISQPAFEVGDEVRQAFLDQDKATESCFVPNERGRWQADLYALARRRLEAMGVTRIAGGGYCTYRDKARFFSYRRNPDCGRMVSFVAIEALEKPCPDAI